MLDHAYSASGYHTIQGVEPSSHLKEEDSYAVENSRFHGHTLRCPDGKHDAYNAHHVWSYKIEDCAKICYLKIREREKE